MVKLWEKEDGIRDVRRAIKFDDERMLEFLQAKRG